MTTRLRGAAVVFALCLAFPSCEDSELRAAREALQAAAPVEFAAWAAAVEATQRAEEPETESSLYFLRRAIEQAVAAEAEALAEANARAAAATDARNEALRIAREAAADYRGTFEANRANLRLPAGRGFGIGVGAGARASVHRARRVADARRGEFEAADAEMERVQTQEIAEFAAFQEANIEELRAARSLGQRAVFAAWEAEGEAEGALEAAAPEAWAAHQARVASVAPEEERRAMALARLLSILEILLILLVAAIPAKIARRKGRTFWRWWAYGLFLFPVAIIHSITVRRNEAPPDVIGIRSEAAD